MNPLKKKKSVFCTQEIRKQAKRMGYMSLGGSGGEQGMLVKELRIRISEKL